MKTMIIIILLLGLMSCASQQKTGHLETDALITHIAKGPVVVGKDFDEKFKKDGFINGEYIAIGSSTDRELNHYHAPLRMKAESNAMARLLASAPTDFKRIVMSAANTVTGDQTVEESQIQITEVLALTGLKVNFNDYQCVKTAHPNSDMKYDFIQECRVIIRIPASKLMEAYRFTLGKKYSIEQQNKIQDMIMNQMSTSRIPTSNEVVSNK